jgi:hypothetical protein
MNGEKYPNELIICHASDVGERDYVNVESILLGLPTSLDKINQWFHNGSKMEATGAVGWSHSP